MDHEMKESRRRGRSPSDAEEPAFSVTDRRPVLREDIPAEPAPRYPTLIEQMQARADESERKAREISAAYRRLEEERDAFRERLARDLERRVDIARVDMMRKVLGVLDDLDRAIAAGSAEPGAGALLSGVGLIRDHLLQVLGSEGVRALDLEGQRFDPEVAEAISIEETDDPARDGLIVAQSGRGYAIGKTLLRPARVRVARLRNGSPPPSGPG